MRLKLDISRTKSLMHPMNTSNLLKRKERIIVGVNQFTLEEPPFDKHFSIDDSIREVQKKYVH